MDPSAFDPTGRPFRITFSSTFRVPEAVGLKRWTHVEVGIRGFLGFEGYCMKPLRSHK